MIARIALPRYDIKANFIVIDIEKGEVKLIEELKQKARTTKLI
jgi:hypothetical protein